MPTPLPSEEEILARFHRLRITINLSATKFGYLAMGQPDLVRAMTEGRKLRDKSKKRVVYCLDELEREHSEPIPTRERNENIPLDVEDNVPTHSYKPSPLEE